MGGRCNFVEIIFLSVILGICGVIPELGGGYFKLVIRVASTVPRLQYTTVHKSTQWAYSFEAQLRRRGVAEAAAPVAMVMNCGRRSKT